MDTHHAKYRSEDDESETSEREMTIDEHVMVTRLVETQTA